MSNIASHAAALLASLALAQPAQAADPARGAKLFGQCGGCHTVKAGQGNGVGPNLNGVVGAKAATRPGYSASPALARSSLVWTPATLDKFLTKPSALVPGTKMGFGGVAAPADRADIIAYLATLKPGK